MPKKKAKSKKRVTKSTKSNHNDTNATTIDDSSLSIFNFVPSAGIGCYIARIDKKVATDVNDDSTWWLGWEDFDAKDYNADDICNIPDIAYNDDNILSLCNVRGNTTIIAYITIYNLQLYGRRRRPLQMGSAVTDDDGNARNCTTLIVKCPPLTIVHLCRVQDDDSSIDLDIDSDLQDWTPHPNIVDTHPYLLSFPLPDNGSSYLCTQGEAGSLTHFFAGNYHAIDFQCDINTPILAVGDAIVHNVHVKYTNVTGIATSNLYKWNSIMLRMQLDNDDDDDDEPLFVEYVHIATATVSVGDHVKCGQVIGTSGSVGFSPEPHLHLSAFRTADDKAPTVRVYFAPGDDSINAKGKFIPTANKWYNKNGQVVAE